MEPVKGEMIRLDTVGARLGAERRRMGLSQEAFGKLGGSSKPSQVRYESGDRSPDGDYLSAIAKHGADVLYILTGERSAASLPGPSILDMQGSLGMPDFAPVPILDAAVAAGGGAENADEPVIAHLAFRRDWLRRIGVSPTAAVIARARGRSMEPTIHDGDMVLIDRGASTLPARPRDASDQRPARIYALRDDGGARVKRLDLAAPGVLALMSDNPDHPPEFRPVSEVQIIGRVVWWGHTDRG